MHNDFKCAICSKVFTQKSSLVRHSNGCTLGPAPSLRQKSCKACTSSKTKCDLRRPSCSRCEHKDISCNYTIPLTRGRRVDPLASQQKSSSTSSQTKISQIDVVTTSDLNVPSLSALVTPNFSGELDLNVGGTSEPFILGDFSHSTEDLMLDYSVCKSLPVNLWDYPETPSSMAPFFPTNEIQFNSVSSVSSLCDVSEATTHTDDWLIWSGGSTQHTPPLVRHSMETLLRVMKTWPRILAKGFRCPPTLYAVHIHPKSIQRPMATCIAIAKYWSSQTPETTSAVQTAILREMRIIFQSYLILSEQQLLSALQALTFYTVMLMYPSATQVSLSLVDPAIFLCLARVVAHVAKTGLMLTEEYVNAIPSWESWIHVTSKRRAVFSLYLLHWSYAVYHSLDSFACSQLGFMPAPAAKCLWECKDRQEWGVLYRKWLEQWGGRVFLMSEFAEIQSSVGLERRTEMWLEDADDLGIMFFSIVNATDRGKDVWDFGRGIAVLD